MDECRRATGNVEIEKRSQRDSANIICLNYLLSYLILDIVASFKATKLKNALNAHQVFW
jgi:hypothetical protein